ncbi:MAG: UDP-N-acetylglucosamine 1-carboxyvinyltransferase [Phycisphaeraceae bacterium]|nr:UDP-N-acetylglucosamine 1-carboxyvinyltransferase [Phycisphaeraceae bacterium]
MDSFVIQGGRPLRGTFRVHGSKNAALPLMAAALLTDQPVVLRDVPQLSDIRNLVGLLGTLGCEAEHDAAERRLTLKVTDQSQCVAAYDIVRTMRAGICVLGPLLARRGRAKVSMPGGCAIGDRPVDLHLRGLRALGAEIHLENGYIAAEGKLRGAHVFLGGPNGSTVLGTDNVMCAAVLAEGTTIIECAACEPEVEDLANMLNSMGARISGAGTPRITIEGVEELGGTPEGGHQVIPDRIEAGTYAIASAITGGEVTLENFPTASLTAALDCLRQIGVTVESLSGSKNGIAPPLRDDVRVRRIDGLHPAQIVTQPHPGFPTDLQAQFMALLAMAEGNSIITEKIYPDRFLHVAELTRMGAELIRTGASVMVCGQKQLVGAPVMASDLRASAALVLAGLAARGRTVVNRVYHLDRGYERMELSLQALGAQIERVDQKDAE